MAKKRRKSAGWRILLFILTLTAILLGVFAAYDWWLERRAHFVHYQEFGIDIPLSYSIHGIDVSKYQNIIDWASVKDMNVANVQIGFVFIKATEGLQNEDAFFARNWHKSKDAGLIRGAYHYFLTTKSGKEQAENFINSVHIERGDLPPVLDIEQAYGVPADKVRSRAKEWLDVVQGYYGITPIIYTNIDFYRRFLKDDFDKYPLWVAHYLQKERPRIYRDWNFWQHSEAGRVNGIVTHVDFDVFNGDSVELQKLLVN